jgi:hypothetical protein
VCAISAHLLLVLSGDFRKSAVVADVVVLVIRHRGERQADGSRRKVLHFPPDHLGDVEAQGRPVEAIGLPHFAIVKHDVERSGHRDHDSLQFLVRVKPAFRGWRQIVHVINAADGKWNVIWRLCEGQAPPVVIDEGEFDQARG